MHFLWLPPHRGPILFRQRQSPGRKEESISLTIFLPAIRVILRRVEIRPHAHGVDVLVLLVPPAIHNFQQVRVVLEAFELGI